MQLSVAGLWTDDLEREEVRPFSGSLDLSHVARWGCPPFPEPVLVQGELRLRHGEVILLYTAEYRAHSVCSRCLQPVIRSGNEVFEHLVFPGETEELPDDAVVAQGDALDLGEIAGADLSLELAPTTLCGEDCKGLCPVCGGDRNHNPCDCGAQKPPDPRFAALRELLDNQED